MERLLYFHICAIIIFAIILFATYIRRATKGTTNRLFVVLMWMGLVSTTADLITELIIRRIPLSQADIIIVNICLYSYFILRNGMIVVYLFFIFSVTHTIYRMREASVLVPLLGPYGVLVCALALNPMTHAIFTVTAEGGYERGPHILLLYFVSIMYALGGTGYLIYCRRFLTLSKWISLLSMYILSFIAIFLQLFIEELLVEPFSTSIAFLLIILLVQRPEEIMDPLVGLPSWNAYKTELDKVIAAKQPVQIVAIRFINANQIRTFIGEEIFNLSISEIAFHAGEVCRGYRLSFDLFFEHPGNLYILIDGRDCDLEELVPKLYDAAREQTDDLKDMGVRLIPRICSLSCPEDLRVRDDIISFGHEFFGLVPYGKIYSKASDLVGSQSFMIRSNIAGILNRAIMGHELEMYYQPIYSVKDGRFLSAEALIRLHDSEFGMISPGVFIPAAESRGLILPIGDFVLESVHRFVATHDMEELGLSYIEINLSVAQCTQRHLPDNIKKLSEEYGVRPDQINLEITETTYENTGEVMEYNLQTLSDAGYTFSLDDYGTGYSNIQRVSRLPLKMIKIDKSLVDDMNTPDGDSIMRNTVRMMQDIRKELVIEGVETKEKLDALTDMGVDFIQGFYFSKPLPADEFVSFLKEHKNMA